MARTKPTGPRRKEGPITWTRFRLLPSQEWPPAWPWLGNVPADDDTTTAVNTLDGVAGTAWCWCTLGRMVDYPQEAVVMVRWQFMDDINNFLASSACDEFLRLLDGGHEPKQQVELEQQDDEVALDDQQISRRRRRFLIIKHWSDGPKSYIQGRVTLSTYVLPAEVEGNTNPSGISYDTMYRTYLDMTECFGRYDEPIQAPDPKIIEEFGRAWNSKRVWFYSRRTVNAAAEEYYGEDEDEDMPDVTSSWLERIFGSGRSGGDGDGDGRPRRRSLRIKEKKRKAAALMCEFRVWNDFRYEHVNIRWEEDFSRDARVRKMWDRAVGKWISDGRILAWKRERWDFERVSSLLERNRLSLKGKVVS